MRHFQACVLGVLDSQLQRITILASVACPQSGTSDNIFTDVDLLTPLNNGTYSNYYVENCGAITTNG